MDLFVCEKWVARGSVDGSEAWKVSGGWLVAATHGICPISAASGGEK